MFVSYPYDKKPCLLKKDNKSNFKERFDNKKVIIKIGTKLGKEKWEITKALKNIIKDSNYLDSSIEWYIELIQ